MMQRTRMVHAVMDELEQIRHDEASTEAREHVTDRVRAVYASQQLELNDAHLALALKRADFSPAQPTRVPPSSSRTWPEAWIWGPIGLMMILLVAGGLWHDRRHVQRQALESRVLDLASQPRTIYDMDRGIDRLNTDPIWRASGVSPTIRATDHGVEMTLTQVPNALAGRLVEDLGPNVPMQLNAQPVHPGQDIQPLLATDGRNTLTVDLANAP